jgi:hypothetical protein
MASPLDITYRKAGVEYHLEKLSEMAGWNADCSDMTLGRDEFSEIRNFRQLTPGAYDVRRGVETYPLTGTMGGEVLAKCEFRADHNGVDTFFDITLWQAGGNVALTLLDTSSGEPTTAWQTNVPVTTIAQTAESWVVQFAYALVVTIKGYGSWEVAPNDTTLTSWTVRELGKDVCPAPSIVNFEPKTTGDLFVIDNNGARHGGSNLASNAKIDPNNPGQYLTIPIPLATDYWLVSEGADLGGGTFKSFSSNDLPWWVPNIKDATAKESGRAAGRWSELHNATRAWGYRFVAVQEFTNSKGEKYRVRSAPSVDLWIADMEYAPAQWGPVPTESVGIALDHLTNDAVGDNGWVCLTCAPFGTGQPSDLNAFGFVTGNAPFVTGNRVFPIPNAQALETLQVLFTNYMGGNSNAAGFSNPYIFLADYLGNVVVNEVANCAGLAPYLGFVPASKLKKAPLAVFNWSDFALGALQGTIVEIEVYRTAHSEPDEKDNITKNPNFEAHKYGYVGSILPSGTFTDEVIDDAIDFGTTPEAQDGYLRGQFSGSIMREFSNRLVIGDVVTDYTVLAPTAMSDAARHNIGPAHSGGPATIRGFWYELSSDSATPTHVPPSYSSQFINTTSPTDGLDPIVFFAAYVDTNGVQSDSTFIASIGSGAGYAPGNDGNLYASFVFPRGYAANISKMRLFRGTWTTSGTVVDGVTILPMTRYWQEIAEVDITSGSGVYISKNDEVAVPVVGRSITNPFPGETHRSTTPGAVIYSEANQIYFWPPLNFEVQHQFAPVRMMETVLGPLFVGTDQSIRLTWLDGHAEELTKHIGAISRFTVQKVDKVVFILSAYGMYFVESSGVVKFPAHVQTVVLEYINEKIPGVLPLANARRASIGYLGERMELFVHFPSSVDLGGSLPHRTIIFRLGSGPNASGEFYQHPAQAINYEFDLRPDFELRDAVVTGVPGSGTEVFTPASASYRPEHIVFSSQIMGGLLASFYDRSLSGIVSVDNDAALKTWTGSAVLERSSHMGIATTKKALRELIVHCDGTANVSLGTGQAAPNNAITHAKGTLNPQVRIFPVTRFLPPLRHIVSGQSIESVSTAPITRIWSIPDDEGNHTLSVKAIDTFAALLHNHP